MKKLLSIILAISISGWALAQCDGTHSALDDMSWLSCQGTENPNSTRTEEHWIMYDFGAFYYLNESHFWNYNQADETANGIANFAIDYSNDGENWTWWGDLSLDEAPGTDSYYGEDGPDFDGLLVRYLLLSVVSNHGGPCYGFSEIKIDVDPGVLDIEEPNLEVFSFGLHPNPAKEVVNVQIENGFGAQLTLYSPKGELIWRQTTTSQITRLDLINLAQGIYMVEVVDANGSRATKRLTVVN